MTFHVYAIFDADRRPLYVGQTGNLRQRMAAHASAFWAPRAALVCVTPCQTRAEARALESERIAKLRPPHNRQGNPRCYSVDNWGDDGWIRPLTIRERKAESLRVLRARVLAEAGAA